MDDQRFFDLALKVISQHATEAERSELDAALEREPQLWTEFSRLTEDTRMAKDILPIIGAINATTGEFPAYARERLQTTVRQTLGRPKSAAAEPIARLRPAMQFMPATTQETNERPKTAVPPRHPPKSNQRWSWLLAIVIATAGALLAIIIWLFLAAK